MLTSLKKKFKIAMQNKKIQFVKYGHWLIPATDKDLKILTKFNLRLTKWDADYIETLRLIVSKKNYEVEVSSFNLQIMEPMLEKLERFWARGKNKFLLSKGQIKLLGPNESSNLQKLRTIEGKLRTFFDRWGFEVVVTSNQTKTKCGLTFEYVFSKDHNPVITLADASHVLDFNPAILEMDNHRLVLSQHGDYYGFSFEEKVHGQWNVIKQNSHLPYSKLKSSRMISTLFEMFNLS